MNLKSVSLAALAALTLGLTGPARAGVVMSTNVPVAICDLCTVSSTLTVNSHMTITDLNGLIGSLTHTWDGDLFIQLQSPVGTTVTLSNRHGGSGDNYIDTVFDDEAATAISAAGAPFTGSFRPDQLLSAFDGQDAFGVWTLRVADQAGLDVGSINRWGIDITAAAQNQRIPEPGTLVLAGLALAGLAFTRRHVSK